MAESPPLPSLSRYLSRLPDFQDPSSSSSPLPALYSDLAAHRSSNKSSFDASVDWWARLLFKACLIGAQRRSNLSLTNKGKQVDSGSGIDHLVLHLNHGLVEECTIEEVGRPLGLGTVAVRLLFLSPFSLLHSNSLILISPYKFSRLNYRRQDIYTPLGRSWQVLQVCQVQVHHEPD